MKNLELLCMGCMKVKPDKGSCPYCHFDLEKYQDENKQKGLHYLQPGSILNGRYMIGKVLEEGGFGITYIAWNLNLNIPIAIKEYFPNGFVTRNAAQTDMVTILTGGGKEKFYLRQKERFLDEAKTLGKLDDVDAIVSVKDCFAENGTAYIVMEYLDGEDFGSFIKKNGGSLPPEQVFEMLKPIIKALSFVHEKGLIHRDISPDNIRITEDSKIKLMDFGAARETSDDEKSLSVLIKPGYAPEEQYRPRGNQGAWTDIYALCATMYLAITGEKPIDALERMTGANLLKPSQLGVLINSRQEEALMKGLEVLAEDRWQSVRELYQAIYYVGNSESVNQKKTILLQKERTHPQMQKETYDTDNVRRVSQKEAEKFLDIKKKIAKQLCWFLPVCVVTFSVVLVIVLITVDLFLEDDNIMLEMGISLGITICYIFILYLTWKLRNKLKYDLSAFDYLYEENFELDRGVAQKLEQYRKSYRETVDKRNLIIKGVMVCLSIISLILAFTECEKIDETSETDINMWLSMGYIMLLMINVAVISGLSFCNSQILDSFNVLLQKGSHSKSRKKQK